MRTEITLSNQDRAGKSYLTWAPVAATIRLLEPDSAAPVGVVLGNKDPSRGGQLEFGSSRSAALGPTLNLTLPTDGTPVRFFVAGDFPKASSADGDAIITCAAATGRELSTKAVMVRVRKNANTLSAAERGRFVTALARLNNQGSGLFKDFRAMHRESAALQQAHGAPGFLAWHRAYLLDLERELQKIDASVHLPYWRFDLPAPNLFTQDFLGESAAAGNVTFSSTNLLRLWTTDGQTGISRRPQFTVSTQGGFVKGQAATLLMGGRKPDAIFDSGPNLDPVTGTGGFDGMEGDPHGMAHTSFQGWIRDPATAPRDPLFFLLHCNVDRLWGLWQWFNDRFDGAQQRTYFFRGTGGSAGAARLGHNLGDTMWPWNNVTTPPRPSSAPRTPFPSAINAPGPGATPKVGDMIDYHGMLRESAYAGFAYDDVPYGIAPP
ncbi:MAG: tyrosinase [Solirubrobacteraceae bacterium]|nr:tyrosinase [Solirubrobacteraceae bacterium]